MATNNTTRAQRHDSQRGSERAHDMPRRRDQEGSSPFALMRQGIDEMDRWFNRMGVDRSWMSPASWMSSIAGHGEWAPAIEAFTRGNEFVVRAEVPGMSRTDIHVEAGDDTLTILGDGKRAPRRARGVSGRTQLRQLLRVVRCRRARSPIREGSFNNGVLEVVMQAPSQEHDAAEDRHQRQ